jgi:beta-aspartyl-peptidase (threonine type)
VLVIHGGSGTIRRERLPADVEASYRTTLEQALRAGYSKLEANESALDAVEATIRILEDSPLFNAGRGAVFTAEGRNELDASIMDGSTMHAGAVAGVTTVRHPISAARAVMERSPHVLLGGPGAEAFAASVGLEIVDPGFFFTERRWRQLEERRGDTAGSTPVASEDRHGTVGAVALDRQGRIAAGTSTGGTTFKKHGRIGDSPIIGAGTYAEQGCGVSATGHGEFFIRYAVAHDICARSRYLGTTVADAAEEVVMRVLAEAGGSGGVIALDGDGRPALVFNTEGMYRGWIGADKAPRVAIFGSDDG